MGNIVKVFASCIPVKGHSRALIIDFQRKKYIPVPNTMIDFIEQADGYDLETSIHSYASGEDDVAILREYVAFLLANEIIFFCDSLEEYERFPAINLDWQYPAHLTNAVVEVATTDDVKRFNSFQKSFYIPFVQFIIRNVIIELSDLEEFTALMCLRHVKGIQIVFDNGHGFSEETLINFCNKYPLIETLYAFNSPSDNVHKSLKTFLVLTTQKDYSNSCCGVVNEKYFNPQIEHYTEALQHNTCLNRKIAVDINGDIRNCLSMKNIYGHITDVNIGDIAFNPEFQKVWDLKKDNIKVCKDCEFRYICTDCRAYIEEPDDINSKPLKCGYDPYTCEWQDWSTHPMKQAVKTYYNI